MSLRTSHNKHITVHHIFSLNMLYLYIPVYSLNNYIKLKNKTKEKGVSLKFIMITQYYLGNILIELCH